jgi:Phage capsid family
MLPSNEIKMKAIMAEVKDIADGNTTLTTKALKVRLDELEAEAAQIEASDRRAASIRAGSEVVYTKGFGAPGSRRWAPAPADATEEQWHSMWLAARAKTPFAFELGVGAAPTLNLHSTVRTKAAIAEGPPASLLPSVLHPEHTLLLQYELDRVFDAFKGAAMDSQSVTYLAHTGNTNPAAATAELGQFPDLGMQLTPKTVNAQKITALASVSTEAAQDFDVFHQFISTELTRALIDAETNWILNSSVTGLIWQSELPTPPASQTLTRVTGADTALNALDKAINDLRVGAAFAKADTMIMHPQTLHYLRRQTDTLGRYLLIPAQETVQNGDVNSIWNCRVIQNTYLAPNYVVVFDSQKPAILAWTREALRVEMNPYGSDPNTNYWSQGAIGFRAEERIAIGYPFPKATCVVSGFPGAGS